MKPNINLADHALLPKEPQFTLNSLVLALLLVATLMGAIAGWSIHVAHRQADERAAMQAQHDRVQRQIAQVAAELAPRNGDPDSAQRVLALTQEGNELRRISRLLDGGLAGATRGFSASLAGLAENRVDGVWLTAFTLAPDRAEFVGRTLGADRLPLFIVALGRIDDMRDRSFATIELKEMPALAVAQSAPVVPALPEPLAFRIGPGEEAKR